MKIMPEQPTSPIIHHSTPRVRIDLGAYCFFILGMFICAMILHLSGILPSH